MVLKLMSPWHFVMVMRLLSLWQLLMLPRLPIPFKTGLGHRTTLHPHPNATYVSLWLFVPT